jgi:hypothetical protein
VPRPRSSRTDLPAGLYHDADGFRLRRPDGSKKRLGHIERETAITAWVKAWGKEAQPPEAGTFAELIDAYERLGLPAVKSDKTRKEYARQLGHLRKRWGTLRYARTEVEAARDPAVMRPGLFTRFLDAAAALPKGATQARQDVRLASTVFSWACGRDYTLYHPVRAVKIGRAPERRVKVPDAVLELVLPHLPPAPRLIVRLDWLIGARATDARLLTRAQIRDALLSIRQHKTGAAQDWILTPGVRAILEDAKQLKGASRSLYVFPSRLSTPYTEGALSRAWRRACERAVEAAPPEQRPALAYLAGIQFRDLRKRAINKAKQAGMNATDFAGHMDPRTTRAHYEIEPVTVMPLDGGKT